MTDGTVSPRVRRQLKARGFLSALEAELLAAGIEHYALVMGGKHPKLRFEVNGVRHCLATPNSGHSRGQARQNGVAQIRRILRGAELNPRKAAAE